MERVAGGLGMVLADFPPILVGGAGCERYGDCIILVLMEYILDGREIAGLQASVKKVAEGAEEGRLAATVLTVEEKVFARVA